MTESKHTPIRIEIDDDIEGYPFIQLAQDIPGSAGVRLFGTVDSTFDEDTDTFSITDEDRARATRLILAWNSHDALLDALREANSLVDLCSSIEQANMQDDQDTASTLRKRVRAIMASNTAAIALAEGK